MADRMMPPIAHTEIDPEERDQRLGQVYRLLIGVARRERAAEQVRLRRRSRQRTMLGPQVPQAPKSKRPLPAVDDYLGKDWIDWEDLVATLVEGCKAAGIGQRAISYALNLGTIHNEATIIRLAAQGHTNEGIATLLDTTEGTIRNRQQRIRRWLTALAEKKGVANLVEAWDKTGGDHHRATVIQNTYPNGRKPEMALAG